MDKKVAYTDQNTVQLFTLRKSSNKKIIGDNQKILQSFVFSKEQYEYVLNNLRNGLKSDFKTFFSLDQANCFDCPFSSNSGNGKCYTHKPVQYIGFISSVKSLAKQYGDYTNIPTYSNEVKISIVKLAIDKYVRFGSYGEPSLHPIDLVDQISKVANTWTGYTHQWFKKPEYAKWLMASVHSAKQAETAKNRFDFRSFLATDILTTDIGVTCPASKEAGYKSNCAKCGLCSGTNGKGKKDVVILQH